jgi:hypothetical protein
MMNHRAASINYGQEFRNEKKVLRLHLRVAIWKRVRVDEAGRRSTKAQLDSELILFGNLENFSLRPAGD